MMRRSLPMAVLLTAMAASAGFSESIDSVDAVSRTDETESFDERPLADLGARIAYNSDHGAVVGASVATERLFGSHRLRFAVEVGEDRNRLNLSYGVEDMLGGNPALGIGAFAMTSEASDVYAFDSETFSVEPRLTWRLGAATSVAAYLGLSWASIHDVDPETSILIRENEGDRARQVVGVSYTHGIDGAGSTLRRLAFGATVEAGRTDRGHEFAQVSARMGGTWALGQEKPVFLRAQLRASSIESLEGESHIGDRIFLGSSSIRGFAFGGFGPRDLAADGEPALGGNRFAVARFDAQFARLTPDARFLPGIFLDMGSLWHLDNTSGGPMGVDPVDDAFSLRASAGASMRIQTGIGPVMLTIAHPFEREASDRVQQFGLSFQQSF